MSDHSGFCKTLPIGSEARYQMEWVYAAPPLRLISMLNRLIF